MKFRIGQTVVNRKRPEWGEGEIVDLADGSATVIFRFAGEKKMALSFLDPSPDVAMDSGTGGEEADRTEAGGRDSIREIAPGSLAFEAELKRRVRGFLAIANRAGIEKIEEKIYRAFLQGDDGGLRREIEGQLRGWVDTNPRGRHAQAIPAARALYDLLFLSAPPSRTESGPSVVPSGSTLPSTYSLRVVSLLADSPLLRIAEGERPRYRIQGNEVHLQPGVDVVQPGQVPVFRRWQDRLILLAGDEQHADLLKKVSGDRFGDLYENAPRVASANSEDAVTWSLLRALERHGPAHWLQAVMAKGLARAGNEQAASSFPAGSPRFGFWQRVSPPPSLPTREGDTEFDALAFVGEDTLVSIEAKVGAGLSPGTTYDPTRNQFIRTLDVGSWFAERQGRVDYWPAILLPAGNDEDIALVRYYVEDPTRLAAALPHRDATAMETLARKIAILTWEDILDVAATSAEISSAMDEPNTNTPTTASEELPLMLEHPLVTRSQDTDVTTVSRFVRAAQEITSLQLAEWYRQELAAAPRRADRGKSYFVGHDGRPSTGDYTNRGEEHLAIALFNQYGRGSAGLPLPSGEPLAILDYQFPLKARQSDRGVGKIDLLGALTSGRLCVGELKRKGGGSPETPLRGLLEGLAYAAIVQANIEAIAAEARAYHGIDVSNEQPAVMVLAPEEYWDYFQYTPQAGAWRAAMRELATRVEGTLGNPVLFLGLGECEVSPGLRGGPATLLRPVKTHWIL